MVYTNSNTQVHVLKVKFKHLGEGGVVLFKYNFTNGRYESNDLCVDQWHYNNFLIPELKPEMNTLPIGTSFNEPEVEPIDERFLTDEPPF